MQRPDTMELKNFFISVGPYLRSSWSCREGEGYDLYTRRNKARPCGQLNAREVFEKLSTGQGNRRARHHLLDRLNKDNPSPQLGELESTNVCYRGCPDITDNRVLVR